MCGDTLLGLCGKESHPLPQKAVLPIKKQVGRESAMGRKKEARSVNKFSPGLILGPHPSQHTLTLPAGQPLAPGQEGHTQPEI